MPSALKNKFFKKISFRMAALFCLTFSIGVAIAFAITYFEIEYTLEKSSKEVISMKLQEATLMLNDTGVDGLKKFLAIEKYRIQNAPFMFRVLSSDGKALFLKGSVQEKKFDFDRAFKSEPAPKLEIGWHSLQALDDEDKFDILTQKVGDYYVQVGKSSEDREDVLDSVSQVFVFTGGALILLSGILGFWYTSRILKPIRRLLNTIRKVEKGNFDHRVSVKEPKDELYQLGTAFNRMIGRIENLVRVQRDSLDHVAHDIRTPLTRIKAVAEDAMTSSNPPSLKEALEECAEGATNISEIVDQLMSISEAESGTMKLAPEKCNVLDLLNEIADVYEFVAMDKEIIVECSAEPKNLTWSLDRKRIKQAIGNLLDNALKFSPDESRIRIFASTRNGELEVSVTDQGIGISQEDLPQIFERLFRGDKSRTTKGAGLGLSIVRAIVSAHGGTVSAQPSQFGGTTFAVLIPTEISF